MTINIGVDLHKTQFTTYTRGAECQFGKFSTTSDGYRLFFQQVEAWQSAGHIVRAGVESTGNTRYFKTQLEKAGIEVKVINTLKFKVVNESVKKTDRHDAATIAEFLEKDMLPESVICSEASEQLRRMLTIRTSLVRTVVGIKNQIHSLLVSLGMEDCKSSLQSKRGRLEISGALERVNSELVAQSLFDTIDLLEMQVKKIEQDLERLVKDDEAVQLLRTIPGCGLITASAIRAGLDTINRFDAPKKLAAYAGLVPWVQSSNMTSHYGKITKRGPELLRTALVQLVLGMVRCKKTTASWRIMERYQRLKSEKGSGRSIIATARKLAMVIWQMLKHGEPFSPVLMTDSGLVNKTVAMRAALKPVA